MAIIVSGRFPSVSGVVVSRRIVNVELSATNPSIAITQPGAYEFRLDTETLTSTTVTINSAPVTVADVGGQFVWDQGGDGEYTFTYVGETIYRTYGGETYQIGWLGLGSQKFFARSVLNAQAANPPPSPPPPPPPPADAPPVWSTPAGSIGSFQEGLAVSFQFVATDDSAVASYAITGGSLPGSISLSSGGLLSGTAPNVTTNQTYSFDVTVFDDTGQSTARSFSLDITNVNQSPVWTTAAGSLGTFSGNAAVNTTVVATDPDGSIASYAVVSGSLPGGLSLNASTGAITGTATNPASATTSYFTIRATDNSGGYTDRAFSITVTVAAVNYPNTTYTASATYNIYNYSYNQSSYLWPPINLASGSINIPANTYAGTKRFRAEMYANRNYCGAIKFSVYADNVLVGSFDRADNSNSTLTLNDYTADDLTGKTIRIDWQAWWTTTDPTTSLRATTGSVTQYIKLSTW